jgi:hypothetical protein
MPPCETRCAIRARATRTHRVRLSSLMNSERDMREPPAAKSAPAGNRWASRMLSRLVESKTDEECRFLDAFLQRLALVPANIEKRSRRISFFGSFRMILDLVDQPRLDVEGVAFTNVFAWDGFLECIHQIHPTFGPVFRVNDGGGSTLHRRTYPAALAACCAPLCESPRGKE